MIENVELLTKKLSELDGVECIMLSGSQTNGTADEDSDYDIYVYTSKEIPAADRKSILDDFFIYSEIDNKYWETEDDGILKDGEVTVELIYRGFDFIENEYKRIFERNEAWVGYSTCIWSNFMSSEILFDKTGKGAELLKKYKIQNYPEQLKINIIKKNYPLLIGTIPAYYSQIEKAILRKDLISVNHRVAAFFASYFDILFAINELPHPGEKKLMKYLKRKCDILPENYKKRIKSVIKHSGEISDKILKDLRKITTELDTLLEDEGLKNKI